MHLEEHVLTINTIKFEGTSQFASRRSVGQGPVLHCTSCYLLLPRIVECHQIQVQTRPKAFNPLIRDIAEVSTTICATSGSAIQIRLRQVYHGEESLGSTT